MIKKILQHIGAYIVLGICISIIFTIIYQNLPPYDPTYITDPYPIMDFAAYASFAIVITTLVTCWLLKKFIVVLNTSTLDLVILIMAIIGVINFSSLQVEQFRYRLNSYEEVNKNNFQKIIDTHSKIKEHANDSMYHGFSGSYYKYYDEKLTGITSKKSDTIKLRNLYKALSAENEVDQPYLTFNLKTHIKYYLKYIRLEQKIRVEIQRTENSVLRYFEVFLFLGAVCLGTLKASISIIKNYQ